ncbi:hypothetical protein [Thermoactinomyces sp. DSM 45891]|uniref:hypothetical protein n=1 Tax=Thermoactinomyces sp. DSM 45891 TaxID=1761907 RepID=UPI00116137B1|nr:hypothetical protein [Thermoactinomyces sp. DSM 45891]
MKKFALDESKLTFAPFREWFEKQKLEHQLTQEDIRQKLTFGIGDSQLTFAPFREWFKSKKLTTMHLQENTQFSYGTIHKILKDDFPFYTDTIDRLLIYAENMGYELPLNQLIRNKTKEEMKGLSVRDNHTLLEPVSTETIFKVWMDVFPIRTDMIEKLMLLFDLKLEEVVQIKDHFQPATIDIQPATIDIQLSKPKPIDYSPECTQLTFAPFREWFESVDPPIKKKDIREKSNFAIGDSQLTLAPFREWLESQKLTNQDLQEKCRFSWTTVHSIRDDNFPIRTDTIDKLFLYAASMGYNLSLHQVIRKKTPAEMKGLSVADYQQKSAEISLPMISKIWNDKFPVTTGLIEKLMFMFDLDLEQVVRKKDTPSETK